MMKTMLMLVGLALLTGCGEVRWEERTIPTTEGQRRAIAKHVEEVLRVPYVMAGSDQDFEDTVNAVYYRATEVFCRKTYWEYYFPGVFDAKPSGYTGRWKYADGHE